MKVFNFDPRDYACAFRNTGYLHIKGGMTPEFHAELLTYAARELAGHKLDSFAIHGKKEQALYELPAAVDVNELYDVVCAACGLDRAKIKLSERHVQMYEANAAPEPPAHKDRYPSQVAVGFAISIPPGSQLVLYPYSHREINQFNTSVGLRRHTPHDEQPEIVLKQARELTIDDADGDIVMFPGSTTWHFRRRSANSLNLYMKFNDFGCDPLGEDPFTQVQRARSVAALSEPMPSLLCRVPVLAPQLDTIARTATRDGWREVAEMRLFGEEPIGLTEFQYEALKAVDARLTVSALATQKANGMGWEEAVQQILSLARNGALDFAEPNADAPTSDVARPAEHRPELAVA